MGGAVFHNELRLREEEEFPAEAVALGGGCLGADVFLGGDGLGADDFFGGECFWGGETFGEEDFPGDVEEDLLDDTLLDGGEAGAPEDLWLENPLCPPLLPLLLFPPLPIFYLLFQFRLCTSAPLQGKELSSAQDAAEISFRAPSFRDCFNIPVLSLHFGALTGEGTFICTGRS